LKQALKHIGNIVLMVVLLVSTTGLTIYKLHCNCLQDEQLSVLIEPQGCHSDADSDCCSGTGECTHQSKHHQNSPSCADCDTHEAFFVKLSIHFLAGNATVVAPPVQLETTPTLFSEITAPKNLDLEKELGIVTGNPPPLIISGQKIITLFHQFKFDDTHSQLI